MRDENAGEKEVELNWIIVRIKKRQEIRNETLSCCQFAIKLYSIPFVFGLNKFSHFALLLTLLLAGCCSDEAEAPHQITSTRRFDSLPTDSAMPLLFDSTLSSARICLRFVAGFWCLENGFAINQASKFRANKWIHNLIISSDVCRLCRRWFLCKTPIN